MLHRRVLAISGCPPDKCILQLRNTVFEVIFEHFKDAFSRSWTAAWDSATGQGIALTRALGDIP
jgi:hypothetical protein